MLYAIALLGGLALSWPALSAAMHGDGDILTAGIRLLVSVAAVWGGTHLVNTLIGGYASAPAAAKRTATSSPNPGRRASDPVPEPSLTAGDTAGASTTNE